MNRKTLFKIFISFMSSTTIMAMVGLSTISCGSHKPDSGSAWNKFKTLALKETAPNLKSVIPDILQYHWKNNDVAVFDSDGGIPTVYENAATINAIIVIKNAKNNITSLPINCVIQFHNQDTYNLEDWTFSQDPNIYSWLEFKAAATLISATDLLTQVQKSVAWSTFKWSGDASINVWKASDLAEFDIYGGLNDGQDPYKGMNGKPTANDLTHTITAIISINDPTKRGLYNANPIKSVITRTYRNKDYKVSDWKFIQDHQLQSKAKYLSLFHEQVSIAQLIKKEPDKWIDLITHNWSRFPQWSETNSIFDHSLNIFEYLSHGGYPGAHAQDYLNSSVSDIPITGGSNGFNGIKGLQNWIFLKFIANDSDCRLTLTTYFFFSPNSTYVGSAFDYLWKIKPIKIIH